MNIKSNIWFENKESGFFGKGRIELLKKIDKHGSITAAAKAMKMSYKAAWDAVNEMNNLSDSPIVEREAGGKGGGGTVLTEKGCATIALYEELEAMQTHFWSSLKNIEDDAVKLEQFAKRMTIRTSARNQLLGVVKDIQKGKLKAKITLRLSGGEEVVVFITTRSFNEMSIQKGMELFIILKSSWIKFCNPERKSENILECSVDEILLDYENVEITLLLKGGNILTLSMSEDSFRAFGLEIGDSSHVCFGASDALLAV